MSNLGATIRFKFVFTRQSGSVMVINSTIFSRQPNDGAGIVGTWYQQIHIGQAGEDDPQAAADGADVEFNQTGIELRPVVHEEPGTVKTYLYRDL